MTAQTWKSVLILLLSTTSALAQSHPPLDSSAAAIVSRLGSEQHRMREAALAQISLMGAPTVAPLLAAAVSKDPELAWRATEALQILGQTADNAREKEIKQELSKASRSTIPAQAALANKLLQQWPLLRHHYAATQLELLGAEVVDNPNMTPTIQVGPGGGPVGLPVPGGVFFAAGIMPALPDDGDEMIVEEVEAEEIVVADDGPVIKVGDPAPAADRKPAMFGELLKVIGRAAGAIVRDEDAAGEALGDAMIEALMKREAAGPEVPRDIEFVEEPPVAMEELMEVDAGFDVDAAAIEVALDPLGADGTAASDQLQPGTVRIGKQWRGGDAGLEYLAQLQQIHTVILREAPLTDAALAHFHKLPSLSYLKVQHTPLSSAALLKLRHARPNINISAVGPAVLGVSGSDTPGGLLVQQVTPEAGARRAGLDEQDIITKIDDLKVSSLNDVMLALYDKTPGRKVKVEYLRGGSRKVVEVTLTSRDEAPAPDQPVAAPATIHSVPIFRGFGGGLMPFMPR